MAATPVDVMEPEPFSPSAFLDLPPTPRPQSNGDGEDLQASSDDMVLPFIRRMLMEDEEDTDQDSILYHDHPALLLAQQPFARILSASACSTDSDSGTSATDSASGTSATTNSTWPYDPVELSQQLLWRTRSGAAVVGLDTFGSSPGQGSSDTAIKSSSFGQGVTMDMLNLAFLKGMEEANRFLPTNNDLINCNQKRLLMTSTSRNSKAMAPEPEETSEMVDQAALNLFNSCLQDIESLRIAVGVGDNKNTGRRRKKQQQSPAHEAAAGDLPTLLLHCAEAVGTNDRRSATQLLRQIRRLSSPSGDANQRLAHYFAQGLEARLAGTGNQVYRSLVSRRTSLVEYLKAYQLYVDTCCFKTMAFRFSNLTIRNAIIRMLGRKKVHIVDYGIGHGLQWPVLLRRLSTLPWEGGPPEVRITGIDLPEPGFRPSSRIEQTGRRLSSYARQFGVPFKFRGITAKWETIRVDDLDIEADELLIVNSLVPCGYLMDDGVTMDTPSPRDVVLNNIREMHPHVFILCTVNASYSSPFFVTRFREALLYYSAIFDMLDATTSRDDELRLLVERDLYGQCALNVVACEGLDRVERPETYKQWQVRNNRSGLRQLPLDPCTVKDVRERVKSLYHRDFVIDVDQQWLLQGWKGRILYAMSTWVADEST